MQGISSLILSHTTLSLFRGEIVFIGEQQTDALSIVLLEYFKHTYFAHKDRY
jgi:hypothetical protein